MKILDEDYTAGVLAGVPIFCVNRIYTEDYRHRRPITVQYRFRFDNGYGASILEFDDKTFSGGHRYELAVLRYAKRHEVEDEGGITYDTLVTSDVERGNAIDMHRLLNQIEEL